MTNIDLDELRAVTGGASATPLLLPKPFTPPANMGGPKYSAAWWDLVRSRGVFK
jgi:hypothetical protein